MALAMWSMTTLVAPVWGRCSAAGSPTNLLAVDLLHQRAGRPARRFRLLAISAQRETPTRSCRSTASAWRCWCMWVGALQIMLDKGKELDWFDSTQIVVLAVVAWSASSPS